jgi:hypothetical protein
MKTTFLQLAAVLLLLAGGVASCGKENEDPIEIPFEEYSLANTNCGWHNLNYNNTVIIINNNAELENYITCTEGIYPTIDFSKNTLLLASGGSGAREDIITTFFQCSNNKYALKVDIYSSAFLPAITTWTVSILTPKISNNATITLDIQETYH